MVGIVNRPHTRRMTQVKTTVSTTLVHFDLSHAEPVLVSDVLTTDSE